MKRISDTEVQLTDDEMILGDFYQYLRTERGLTDEQAMAYLERVSSLAGRLIHGEFLAYLTDGEPLASGRCEMAPESPMPEGEVIEWTAGGRSFRLVEGREYKIVTMIPGVERKPRYSRMHFMGQQYPGRTGPGSTLQFSGRGPDRTHSGKYCGTAGVPVRSILEVEEVERNVAARYAFQRQPEPEAARRDGR